MKEVNSPVAASKACPTPSIASSGAPWRRVSASPFLTNTQVLPTPAKSAPLPGIDFRFWILDFGLAGPTHRQKNPKSKIQNPKFPCVNILFSRYLSCVREEMIWNLTYPF
jgi:hypothetical protein